MKEYIKILAPFLLIMFIFGQSSALVARICDEPVVVYNQQLEGAKVLFYRQEIADGNFPDSEIWLAGTSRTMSDYDPTIISETLYESIALQKVPTIYNLGNVANYYSIFERQLRKSEVKPKLLILEYSPFLFYRVADESDQQTSLYERYKSMTYIQELFVAGWVKKIFGIEDVFYFDIKTVLGIYRKNFERNLEVGCSDIYYALRSNYGYGQQIKNNGQVVYRVYLPNRAAAQRVRLFDNGEYDTYKNVYLTGYFNEDEWESFQRIVQDPSFAVVVVRPPIDPKLYNLENEMLPEITERVENGLRAIEIPYIDMNPHNYFSTDMSHIDWYDTPKVSTDLAFRLIPAVDWDQILRNEDE